MRYWEIVEGVDAAKQQVQNQKRAAKQQMKNAKRATELAKQADLNLKKKQSVQTLAKINRAPLS